MEKIRLLEEALDILEITGGDWATQNLRGQVPAIIEYIINESTGKTDGRWLDESIRLLRPRCGEDNILYQEELSGAYNRIIDAYNHIVKKTGHETFNMQKFKGQLEFYRRYMKLLGCGACEEEATG